MPPQNLTRIADLAKIGAWDLVRLALIEVTHDGMGTQQPWAAARYADEGSYGGHLADLELLWQHAEQQNDLALALHCALIAASIRDLSAKLAPELLVGLVLVGTPAGRWGAAAALAPPYALGEVAAAVGDVARCWP